METLDLSTRVAALERSNRKLRTIATSLGACATVVVAVGCLAAAQQSASPQTLRATTLEIVDARGIVRARLSGELPDPQFRGRSKPRGDAAAGLLLYDSTGQERGGYVTFARSQHIALTLDGRRGQSALFVADTGGGTALRMWRGPDAVDLRVDEDGARIGTVASGMVVFQAPPLKEPARTSMCRDFRALRSQLADSTVRAACRERMTGAACRACLGHP